MPGLKEEPNVPVHNSDIADDFEQIADLLEIRGENPFRVRAYRSAARTVGGLSTAVSRMVGRGEDLTSLQGIGKDLAEKIRDAVRTGRVSYLDELREKTAPGLVVLLRVAGLGGKRVRALHEKLGIEGLDELERAAREHRVRSLQGFGEKTEKKILEEIDRVREDEGRVMLSRAEEIASPLVEFLKGCRGVKKVAVAGSFRRRRETVGDLDILVSHRRDSEVMKRFTGYQDVRKVLSEGSTRCSVILKSGIQVDLRAVAEVSWGAALLYFTGSREHGIALRKLARTGKMKINEYGLYRGKRRLAGKSERSIYRTLGLRYIEPELRSARGEIEAAGENRLPRLVEPGDLRGDLQMHTRASDGRQSIREMAEAARSIGYDYIAITDHSRRVHVANGLDPARLRRQIREIDRVNEEIRGLTVLKSVEVDILEDGSLDLSDDVLSELDLVVGSSHSHFGLSASRQTDRIRRALDHPLLDILAHPTGRLIRRRAPYDFDMEAVMRHARERGVFLEVNAHPERLDLNAEHCRMARDIGVRVAVSTDAHRSDDLKLMRFGVDQARAGWLEPDDILNTRPLARFRKMLRKK
jgi:DNA polymerase (family 10)